MLLGIAVPRSPPRNINTSIGCYHIDVVWEPPLTDNWKSSTMEYMVIVRVGN